jgi:hypothetical protein
MRYIVILTDEVKAQLRALPRAIRREIGHKLLLLGDNLNGHRVVRDGALRRPDIESAMY